MSRSEPLKVAVLGAGKWAVEQHFPVLAAFAAKGDIILRGVANRTTEKASIAATHFGFERTYRSIDELADDQEADCYVILINPKVLVSAAEKLAVRFVPIFTEKSPGWSVHDAIDLARLVKTVNVVGFNRRYMPLARKFKTLVDEMDQPYFAECQFYRHDRRCDEFIMETGIHGIDYLVYLLGDITRVLTNRRQTPRTNMFNWECSMDTVSGLRVSAKFFPCVGSSVERYAVHDRETSAYFESPAVYSSDFPGRIVIHRRGKVAEIIEADAGREAAYHSGIIDEYEDFFRAVRGGGDCGGETISNFRNSVPTMAIAEAVERGETYASEAESLKGAEA